MESAEAQWHAGRLDELLHWLRRQGARDAAPDLAGLLDWLHRRTGAAVGLLSGTGETEMATPGLPADLPEAVRPMLARLAEGRMTSAVTQSGSAQIRLEALGTRPPRPVLVAVSERALTREEASVISHAGHLLPVLRRAREADEGFRAFERTAHQLRLAVFVALMTGEPALARRMTSGAVPRVLDSGRVRLHLLHCPPHERDGIARAHQDPSGYHGNGLLLRCPVYDEHLICLIRDERPLPGTGEPGLAERLRRLVRDTPGYALGVSLPHPLRATAEAYDQARHALAVARNSPGRVVAYEGQASLAGVLPRQVGARWARGFLRPLRATSTRTVEVTHLALQFHRGGVAQMLGISRNTVTAHVRRAEEALGLDLRDVRPRAALALALNIPDDEPGGPGEPGLTLADVLHTDDAPAEWAHTFLEPLRHDGSGRDLRGTLRAWIETNADAQETARRLGRSRATVREHLRVAETLLNRDLMASGSGIHDVVHALHLTGDIPQLLPHTGAGQQAG